MNNNQLCQDILNTLHEYAFSSEFIDQMQIARELFALATGMVRDDDPFYDSRMTFFQEFFVFDYRLSDVFSGSTVFEAFLLNAQTQLNTNQIQNYEQIRNFRLSIFKVLKLKNDRVIVTDLLGGYEYDVSPLPEFQFVGFDVGQIFQARIVTLNAENFFTGAFVFHPRAVFHVIEKTIRKFLDKPLYCRDFEEVNWSKELDFRQQILNSLTERKNAIEKAEKKKSIELLNVTKQLVNVSRIVSSPNLIMSIGRSQYVSPFVPETALLDTMSLLQRLAHCELRTYRYKHIDPVRFYAGNADELGTLNVSGPAKPAAHT